MLGLVCFFSYTCKYLQWRIQDFPDGARQPLSLGQKPIIWQDFWMKMKEIGPRGSVDNYRPPLKPPMIWMNDTINLVGYLIKTHREEIHSNVKQKVGL